MSDLAWMRPKLAELCGLSLYAEPFEESSYLDQQGHEIRTEDWRPDEDVAQAVRCLEAMQLTHRVDLRFESVWFVAIYRIGTNNSAHCKHTSLSRAICLAIDAALGWEQEET